jgi:hypothetical protein
MLHGRDFRLQMLGLAVAALAVGQPARADEAVPKLFKIITAKDEVVIGLADDELRSFGPASDLENLANRLVSVGQITVWQYGVTRASDGTTVEGPLRRVAILKSDTLRIEPYNAAPLKVLPFAK